MAHPEQFEFVVKLRNNFGFYFVGKKVLEVGSLDINGSLRDLFIQCDYTGIDLEMGKGVDVIAEGQTFNMPDCTYDTVLSAECFEHNPYWCETFTNMIRMCKEGGLIFFTCATTGRPEHGTSRTDKYSSPFTVNKGWEYYKNLTEQDFIEKIDFKNYFYYYGFEVDHRNNDLYFWGIKKPQKF
jgi:SAM-dependent methyltransferase